MAPPATLYTDCSNPVDIAELLMRLGNPARKPIVGVARRPHGRVVCIEPRVLADQLAGDADVYVLPRDGLDALPPSLNVRNGAARVWFPGLDVERANASEHPFFHANTGAEGRAAIDSIVNVVRSRGSGQPRLLTVDHRDHVHSKQLDVSAVIAAIEDARREDALVVFTHGVTTSTDQARLALELNAYGQVIVLETKDDAERITAALPRGLGFEGPGARVWWPGVGTRSAIHGHGSFYTSAGGHDLSARVSGFVRSGSQPLLLVRPGGQREPWRVPELVADLFDPERDRIIVALARGRDGFAVNPNELAHAVGADGDVVIIPSRPALGRLRASLPPEFSAVPGAICLWLPGMTRLSSPESMPILSGSAELVTLAAEAVHRRAVAPSPGERSDPRHHTRENIQRITQRTLDRVGSRRHDRAVGDAATAAIARARAQEAAPAYAAFTDATQIILDSLVHQLGPDSSKEVFVRSSLSDNWFRLGQACGKANRSDLRSDCIETALQFAESALRIAVGLGPVAVEAGVDLHRLRTKAAEQNSYAAQRRRKRGDFDGAAAASARALVLYDEAMAATKEPHLLAWTLYSTAMMHKHGRGVVSSPRLTGEERALVMLQDAVELLTGDRAYEGLAYPAVLELDPKVRRRLPSALLAALADSHIETGEHELARRVFRLLEGYPDESGRDKTWAALRHGKLELDHGDVWAGVARLEWELSRVQLDRLGSKNRGMAISAIQALTAVLNKHNAWRESEFYGAWATRLGHSARLGATAKIRAPAPEARALASSSVTAYAVRCDELAERLERALVEEHVHLVVTNLRALGRHLRNGAGRESLMHPEAELEAAFENALQAIRAAQAWQPRRRATPLALPPHMTVVPDALSPDPRQGSVACVVLAIDFAEHYAPGLTSELMRELIGGIIDMHGSCPEVGRIALAAAERASASGRWHDAVRAYLQAARAALEDSPQQARELAARASDDLQRWLGILGLGDDRARAVEYHERSAVTVAEIMIRSGAPAADVFERMDRAKAQVLLAARESVAADPSELTAARDLRNLQLAELDYHLSHSDAPGDPSATAARDALSRQIGAARRRLLRVDPDSVRRMVDSGLPSAVPTLRRLTEPTAVVQYLTIRGALYASAARTTGDGQVDYWCTSKPLAALDEVRVCALAMWDDVGSAVRSVAADASFEDGFEILLGGRDRDTGGSLSAFLARVGTIVVVPGAGSQELSATASIPFHALVHAGRSLVESHDVLYAPSATFWAQAMAGTPERSGRAIAAGTDAGIGALDECADVSSRVGALQWRTLDDDTQVRRVLLSRDRELAVDYDIVHIAAHGVALPSPNHMQSAIELSGVQLTGHDWLLRGARAHLVFMNTCSLGRQVGRAGDLYGMPFAVLASGSGSTVSAVTPVTPTHAHEFASRFYDGLNHAAGRLAACGDAMRAAIAAGAPRSAWVPYFFSGDPRPLPR